MIIHIGASDLIKDIEIEKIKDFIKLLLAHNKKYMFYDENENVETQINQINDSLVDFIAYYNLPSLIDLEIDKL